MAYARVKRILLRFWPGILLTLYVSDFADCYGNKCAQYVSNGHTPDRAARNTCQLISSQRQNNISSNAHCVLYDLFRAVEAALIKSKEMAVVRLLKMALLV
jgi:hypothetical protein